MNTWVLSDLHFGNLPTTPEEQEDWFTGRLNAHIKPGDIQYHIGYFAPRGKYDYIVRILGKLSRNWNRVKTWPGRCITWCVCWFTT